MTRTPAETLLRFVTLPLCVAIAVFAAIVPVASTFFRTELSYNEGWNISNAATLAAHGTLYPLGDHLTTVNYPMGWYVVLAALNPLTHDFLFTGRILSLLSLIALSVFVGLIARQLGATLRASRLGALFCFALFCALSAGTRANTQYLNANDPQMLALALSVAAAWLYLRARQRQLDPTLLASTAALFVAAGFVKHNGLALPCVVLLDLAFRAPRKAALTLTAALALTLLGILAHLHFGGPGFFHQLLAKRVTLPGQTTFTLRLAFGTILVPALLALAESLLELRERRLFAPAFLALSFALGLIFSRAQGVSVNAFFEAFVALALLLALQLSRAEHTPARALYPLALFTLLFVPICHGDTLDVPARLHDLTTAQQAFGQEVAFLRAQPGPALCESILRCYAAGKPYLYDPFNATRLIALGTVSAAPLNNAVSTQTFGAIELQDPIETALSTSLERFPPSTLAAIHQHYRPALLHHGANIYVPLR